MPQPEARPADSQVARRTALATAVFDALEGIDDAYPYAQAASAGWPLADFGAAVARVVRAARTELERPRQQELFDAAAA